MSSGKKMSSKVKLRGLMCQTQASTAVSCMPNDTRSVTVPRRTTKMSIAVHQHDIIRNNVKYTRVANTENINCKVLNKDMYLPLSERCKRTDRQPPPKVALESRHLLQKKPSAAASALNSLCTNDLFQVVVLRVSLHCQGCAGKVKKHLSKMEGVTSFNIDLETKRVTVMGHVSPAGVLESVSRVKRAELWTC